MNSSFKGGRIENTNIKKVDNIVTKDISSAYPLYDADPDCVHEIERQWSGVKCRKCNGWFCY